jgi:hypothetical protein
MFPIRASADILPVIVTHTNLALAAAVACDREAKAEGGRLLYLVAQRQRRPLKDR